MPEEVRKTVQLPEDMGGDDALPNENPIADLLAGPDEETGAAESDSTIGQKPPSAEQARLDKIEEENIALRQRLDIQAGQMNILTRQRQQSDAAPPPKPPEPRRVRIPSKEVIEELLGKPETALEGMTRLFNGLGQEFNEALDDVRRDAQQNFQTRDNSNRIQRAMQSDQAEAVEEFGADLLKDAEFIKDADSLGDRLAQTRGSDNYIPGDFHAIATRTYRTWEKNGKLDAWNAKKNGKPATNSNNRSPSLREVTRSVRASDVIDGSNGSGGGESGTLADFYNGDARELRIARYNMKQMGMSEADWMRNIRAAKAEDPGFGR